MYQKFIKRIIDFIFSLIGLLLLSPLFLIIAIIIKKGDGGSVFFRQTRVGQNGKLFKIYKFRTMIENAEELGAQVTKGDDPRITKVGKFLRKYKLDELPQLINVLKGDMSLVGPRPEVPKYVKAYENEYKEILKVKPGITDYAALEYIDEEEILKNAENPEEVYLKVILPQKIEYYKKYIKDISLLTDLKLIFKTIIKIVMKIFLSPIKKFIILNRHSSKLLQKLIYPTKIKRFLFFFTYDILAIIFSLYISFLLRFEFSLPDKYKQMFLFALPYFILIKIPFFIFFNFYKITWRYVGIKDFWNIIKGVLISNLLLFILIWTPFPPPLHFLSLPQLSGFPRSIFLIDAIISLFLISWIRILKRFYIEIIKTQLNPKKSKRTLIIGAGNIGETILRDIIRQNFRWFYPVGFIDDDKRKVGTYIHGIKVLGTINELKNIIEKNKIEAVIIAIPSLNYKKLKNIYMTVKELKIDTIKIIPRIYDYSKPKVSLKDLEDISIEDLLGRQEVKINYDEIANFIGGKVIFISGAGGSIGSEITMQVCEYGPERLICFDIDETALHNLSIKINRKFPHMKENIIYMIGDIKDKVRVEEAFKLFRPQIVFHSAAYKHVPMMEYNPKEAVKVNILGMYLLAQISIDYGVEKFILISTDKAIKPTSVMGATKRMAEYICSSFNEEKGINTKFVSVRFGNVLGSRGSVFPLFLEQIKLGGPITITHKDIKRYFMTISEAVSLVLQASVIGKPGEVLILDMGKPIKIVELAEELIRLHGLEPYKDIDIVFTGLRPGEKLFEELFSETEVISTKHQKIWVVKQDVRYTKEDIEKIISEFENVIKDIDPHSNIKVRELLKKYIKDYNYDYESLLPNWLDKLNFF